MSYTRRRGLGGRGSGDREEPDVDHDPTGEGDGEDGATEEGAGGRAPGGAAARFAEAAARQSRRPERRRRWLISACIVVGALLLGYGVAALWVFPPEASADDASVVRVPDVVGLTQPEAARAMQSAGLELEIRTGMHHREAPEGAVLSQSPLPGQFARPGAPVAIVLSRGPEVHTLPDVVGLSERQATIVLERLGYDVMVERQENPIAAGRAIETRPSAGSELQVPGDLVLVVSEGAPIVVVPDMQGMHIDDAVQILSDAGLELGSISFDPGAVEAPGRIVGQYPPVGYSLRGGDAVELRVSGDRERLNAGDDAGGRSDREGGRGRADGDEESGLL